MSSITTTEYFFSLEDGRIIHCEEKVYRKIFDYTWDLKAIPIDPTKHIMDDLVFSLLLKQPVRQKDEMDCQVLQSTELDASRC